VITIVLEKACLIFASQGNPRDQAVDMAYSIYRSSGIHHEVTMQFSDHPMEYSICQFTDFILEHRLG
jgi:hypothetical protein